MQSIEYVDPSIALSPVHVQEIHELRQKMLNEQEILYDVEMMAFHYNEAIYPSNRVRNATFNAWMLKTRQSNSGIFIVPMLSMTAIK